MAKKEHKGYSTLQLVIASLGFASICIFWSIYNSYVPLILDEKLHSLGGAKLSAAMISSLIGVIMTIDNFFGLIFQPIFGRKSDHMRSRLGKRMPYLVAGIPLCALLFVLIPLAARIAGVWGILLMMLVIIIFNFVMSSWRAPTVAIMPDIVPVQYQSDGNAVVNLVAAGASILSMSAASLLAFMGYKNSIDNGNYLSVFAFGSVVALICLAAMLFLVKWPDNRRDARDKVIAASPPRTKESLRNLNLPRDVKTSMFAMMVALFFISGASDGFNTYYTLFATKMLGMSPTTATLSKTISLLGSFLFAIPAGIAGRRLGRNKSISIGVCGIGITHVIMLTLGILPQRLVVPLLTVSCFVNYSVFILVNINTLPIMLAIGGKERFGAFTGYYYTATFTAAVLCPTLLGYFIGIISYNFLHYFCIVGMIIAFAAMRFVKHGEELSEDDEQMLATIEEVNHD